MSDFLSTRQRRRVQADESSPSEVIDFGVDEEEKKKTTPPKAAFSSPFSFAPSQLWTSAQGALSSASSLLPSIDVLSPPSIDQISSRLPVKPPPPTNTFHASASSPFLSSIQQVDTSPPAPVEMPCRDRTGEFRTTAKSYQMRVQANGHVPEKNKQQAVNESIHFNQLAKRIGRDLSQTCAKMEKLTELAKRKSLFEERNEIEQLSRVIKEDITGLNRQIATLQEYSRARTGGGRSTKQDHNQHSQLVVVGLQSKLANVSKDFQSVLQIRTENMKHERTRREKFSNADPVPFSIPSSSSTPNVRSALLADEPSSSVALDMGELERHQTQSLLMRGDDYVQARASTMETIEGSIHELGQIFTQLASLVSEQGEVVARIDSNVDTTALNIDAAHTELVRYFHSISKNRWLMLKVFGVVLIFSIIFIMFLT